MARCGYHRRQAILPDYLPLKNPQNQVIGVLFVGVPLDTVTCSSTARDRVDLIGTIIMVAGVVLALIFASTVVSTLQRAARQVSGASERIGGIAAQQANGSAQQVWAINAINQASKTSPRPRETSPTAQISSP